MQRMSADCLLLLTGEGAVAWRVSVQQGGVAVPLHSQPQGVGGQRAPAAKALGVEDMARLSSNSSAIEVDDRTTPSGTSKNRDPGSGCDRARRTPAHWRTGAPASICLESSEHDAPPPAKLSVTAHIQAVMPRRPVRAGRDSTQHV